MAPLNSSLLQELANRSAKLEPACDWPAEQLRLLADAGAFGWSIPRVWGGSELDDTQLVEALVELGQACLTTAFILTQYQAAVQRIVACGTEALQARWLPRLARGELFATVGLSHLTTSRARGPGPAVLATPCDQEGFRLMGQIPWVTGGAHADLLVVGATTANGDQLLLLIERNSIGVKVLPSLPLLSLTASSTGPIELNAVTVPAEQVLAGPMPQVMKSGATGGTGSISTSALALAAGWHSLNGLRGLAEASAELVPLVEQLAAQGETLRGKLLSASRRETLAMSAEELRFEANNFAVRTAQCWLAAAKGTGFVSGHPAERAVREAMFFYVWSCPQTVVTRHWNSLIADECGV